MDDQSTIYCDNTWIIRELVTQAAPDGTVTAPDTLALEGWLAGSEGGDALTDAVRVPLPYRRLVTVDGVARAVYASDPIDETLLAAALTPGTPVYEVVRSTDGDYRSAKRRAVKANRRGA